MKTGIEIVGDYDKIKDFRDYEKFKYKKWYSEEELKKIFKSFKEEVEMSGSPDNNGDNSYYSAIYDIEHVLFGDDK